MSAWPIAQARQLRWLAALEEGRVVVRRESDEWAVAQRPDAWPYGLVGRGPTLLAATSDLRGLIARHWRAVRAPRGGR